MPRFREKSTLATALVGIGIIVAALFIVSIIPSLPFVRGTTYKALFTEAGGMKTGDEVRVAGTAVGKVVDLELVGNRVEATFTAKGIRMTTDTTAAIKTGTLLGKRYLGITPGTGAEMDSSDTIPVERTVSPYNITSSIENVSAQIRDFDKPKIETALNSFADAFTDTPENFKATFQNVKALSQTINTRDQALRELLAHANGVSGVFKDRTQQFQQIVTDGNRLFSELQRRKEIVDESLKGFQHVVTSADTFVTRNGNEEQAFDTLKTVNELLDALKKHDNDLSMALTRASGFIGGLSEGVANGPSFAASVALNAPGDIFNYTDILRQAYNPQAPRIPSTPGLPGSGPLPNPLDAPASGAGSDPDFHNPNASGRSPIGDSPTVPGPKSNSGAPSLPLIGGK